MVAEAVQGAAYLALDPGETTGWALFDAEGNILKYGQFTQDEQTEWLTDNITSSLTAVICEDYKNHPWMKQKGWSQNQTSKNIGAIELLCSMRKVPLHLQSNTVKSIGYKYMGMDRAPSNHSISHQFDAAAHGTYWLRVNGILKAMIPDD
jgi:hypothetical protein